QDYKRQQREHQTIPLTAPMIEFVVNMTDVGNFNDATEKYSRPSRSIRNRINRITVHISPYVNGLAPETLPFVGELQAESDRLNIGVKYIALANKIEAEGDMQKAASFTN